MDYFFIGFGSALGAITRHLITAHWNTFSFPYGTLAINVIGSFLIGVIVFGVNQLIPNHRLDLFLRVGICGGFTTFSSFSLDVVHLFSKGEIGLSLVYMVASFVLCIFATFLGKWVVSI